MPDSTTHWDSTPQAQGGGSYQRHKPEETVLYQIVEQHLPAFQSHLSGAGVSLPGFVHDEFRQYLAALTGEPLTLADGVAENSVFNLSALSVASIGLIAYRTGAGQQRQLTWVDRVGTVLGTPEEPDSTAPRLSPDGRRIAVFRLVQGNADIWMLDGARTSRFTFDAAVDQPANCARFMGTADDR